MFEKNIDLRKGSLKVIKREVNLIKQKRKNRAAIERMLRDKEMDEIKALVTSLIEVTDKKNV